MLILLLVLRNFTNIICKFFDAAPIVYRQRPLTHELPRYLNGFRLLDRTSTEGHFLQVGAGLPSEHGVATTSTSLRRSFPSPVQIDRLSGVDHADV